MVFSGHVNGIGPQNGQDYVIVFVLSGFVISWALDRKINYNFNQYLIDRLSRLWSVAIPALLIGCCLDYFGKGIHSQTYVNIINTNYSELKFIISGPFLHESWFTAFALVQTVHFGLFHMSFLLHDLWFDSITSDIKI